jgi:hypothetical protein
VQEPPHRRNVEPFFDFGVRSTLVPATKVAVHLPGQAIPAGWLATPPAPKMTTTNVGGVTATADIAAPGKDIAATANPARHAVARRRPRDSNHVVGLERPVLISIALPPIDVYASSDTQSRIGVQYH